MSNYGYYSKVLNKPFDTLKDLEAAEKKYNDENKEKIAREAEEKSARSHVSDLRSKYYALIDERNEEIRKIGDERCKKVKEIEDAANNAVKNITEEYNRKIQDAFDEADKAVDEFNKKYGYGPNKIAQIYRIDDPVFKNVVRSVWLFDWLYN